MVGVAADVRDEEMLGATTLVFYAPRRQAGQTGGTFVIRTEDDPRRTTPSRSSRSDRGQSIAERRFDRVAAGSCPALPTPTGFERRSYGPGGDSAQDGSDGGFTSSPPDISLPQGGGASAEWERSSRQTRYLLMDHEAV